MMKNSLKALIIGLSIILSALFLSFAYLNKNRSNDVIRVTGLGEKDFTADLIVWKASFLKLDHTLKNAYSALKKDREIVKFYLKSKGIADSLIVFSSVSSSKSFDYSYDDKGNRHSNFRGYKLKQKVEIKSKKVDKVEYISREITELIHKGVDIDSYAPQYYYTKLSELKLEMIATASENGRIRAENIASNAKSELGNLRYAQMGVFQIIAQNSNESYSWGGTYNTSSKRKTATITMKLQFGIE